MTGHLIEQSFRRTICVVPAEKIRLRIGNLAKAVLVTGQAYQDPKDALNEFVSNAADDTSRRPGGASGSG